MSRYSTAREERARRGSAREEPSQTARFSALPLLVFVLQEGVGQQTCDDGEGNLRRFADLVRARISYIWLTSKRSDPALKEYLIFLDKELHFIKQDLDETHLLVDPSVEKFLAQKIEEYAFLDAVVLRGLATNVAQVPA